MGLLIATSSPKTSRIWEYEIATAETEIVFEWPGEILPFGPIQLEAVSLLGDGRMALGFDGNGSVITGLAFIQLPNP